MIVKTEQRRIGFMAYCRKFGVSWTHLNGVLKGERISKSLMQRIEKEAPELLRKGSEK